jgi:hypothetical protein
MTMRLFTCLLTLGLGVVLGFGCKPKAPAAPPSTEISVSTEPAGASVTVDGREAGVTPLKLKVDHGGHFIVLEMAGYRKAFHRIAEGEPLMTDVNVNLERETTALTIDSDPPGASVTVNGQDVGTAPVMLPRQPIGKVKVEMSMTGYSRFSRELTLNDSRPKRIMGELESTTGGLRIATSPGGADVYVNGEFKGRTPKVGGTLRVQDVPEGRHEISARLAGYRDVRLTVLLKRNEDKRVDLPAMDKLPGSLKITSVPSGATVLDGSKVLGKTPLTLRDLPVGPQILTFQMDGYDPVRRTAVVEPGSTISVVGVMSRNVGAITLTTEPPGCSIFLDRELVGKTRRSANEQVSREFRIPDLKGGQLTVAVTHPLYFPAERKVTVRKGETTQIGVIKLRKRWIPDHELTKRNGNTVKGVLIQRSQDGSIIFEESKGIRIEYRKGEILRLRPLELPTEDVAPPR